MKTVVFTPYGSASPETGVIYLLANYLTKGFPDIYQLTFNGICSISERDAEVDWKKDIESWFRCIADQKRLAHWSGIETLEFSPYLPCTEIEKTRRWILKLTDDQLAALDFNGLDLFPLVKDSFANRFGIAIPNVQNKLHIPYLRQLLLACLRTQHATERFVQMETPNLIFIAGGDDFITKGFVEATKNSSADVVVFRWRVNDRCVTVTHPRIEDDFKCPLVLEDIASMRSDYRTWPHEIITILKDIMGFIGISENQMALPIAK